MNRDESGPCVIYAATNTTALVVLAGGDSLPAQALRARLARRQLHVIETLPPGSELRAWMAPDTPWGVQDLASRRLRRQEAAS
jgi:hypothetical protein